MKRNDTGKFDKGNKGGGRPKGSKNKATGELREVLQDFLDNNIVKIQNDFNVLEPKERLDTIIKLLDFALPKLQRTAMHHTIDDKEITSITRTIIDLPENNSKLNKIE